MVFSFNGLILIILLILSLYFDLTRKKIPNFLTFPVMIWGLAYYTFSGGLGGFLFSIKGLLLGAAIFFIPFALGGMGGGDVKLMGAIGAVKGAAFVFQAAVFTALCGGILAVIVLIINGRLLKTMKKVLGMLAVPFLQMLSFRFRNPYLFQLAQFFQVPQESREEKKIVLPYGVAITLGTLLVLSNLGVQWFSFNFF